MTLIAKNVSKVPKKRIFRYVKLPTAANFATEKNPFLYVNNLVTRKALIGNLKVKNIWANIISHNLDAFLCSQINGLKYSLINGHLSPYQNDRREHAELRLQQAETICQHVEETEEQWDVLVIGMDMNDIPFSPAYNKFIECGFRDAFSPSEK